MNLGSVHVDCPKYLCESIMMVLGDVLGGVVENEKMICKVSQSQSSHKFN